MHMLLIRLLKDGILWVSFFLSSVLVLVLFCFTRTEEEVPNRTNVTSLREPEFYGHGLQPASTEANVAVTAVTGMCHFSAVLTQKNFPPGLPPALPRP